MLLLGLFILLFPLLGLIWLILLQNEVSNLKDRLSKLESGQGNNSSTVMQTISPGETKTPVAPSLPVTAHQTPAPGDLSTPVEPVSVVQVFSWVGGFALLLGIGFVIKYAIDNQLLSPQVRIVGSVIFGIVLWAVGVYLKEEKHQTTACTLCASGLSIAYVAFFAAHAYYAFVGLGTTFVLLVITSLLAFGTALWKKSQGIGIFAQVIGFIVPFLLHSEQPNYFFLLSYTAFIALASIGAAWREKWESLLTGSLIFIGISQLVVLSYMSLSQLNLLFGFCLLFGIIFAAIAYQWQKGYFLLGSAIVTFFMLGGYVARCGGTVLPGDATCFFLWVVCLLVLYSAPVFIFPARLADSIPSWVTLLFVGGLGAVYIYTVSYCTYHIENGLIPFSFMCVYGGVYGAVLTGVLNPLKQRDFALAGLGLLNIFFLTWSIICQFEREYLTLFLALEGCAFLFLAKFKQVSWLHGVSIALVGIALAKLFLADIWMLEILARIVVLIGVAVVLITGAFLYQNIKPKKEDESVENQ